MSLGVADHWLMSGGRCEFWQVEVRAAASQLMFYQSFLVQIMSVCYDVKHSWHPEGFPLTSSVWPLIWLFVCLFVWYVNMLQVSWVKLHVQTDTQTLGSPVWCFTSVIDDVLEYLHNINCEHLNLEPKPLLELSALSELNIICTGLVLPEDLM